MTDVLSLTGRTKPVTFDGLGENHGGLAGMARCSRIRCINFIGIVPAPIQPEDIVIGQVLNQFRKIRILTEKMLPRITTVAALVVLVVTVNRLVHTLLHQTELVLLKKLVPQPTPDDLDHVPPCTPEHTFQLLDNLAVAANGSIKSLQIAIDDKNQVIEFLAPCQRDGTQGLRFIHFTVTGKTPYLAVTHVRKIPMVEVLHDVSLVDGLQRPKPH